MIVRTTQVKAYFQELRQSDFARKAGETITARFAVMAFMFGMSILLARALGPAELGRYTVALTITTLGVQFGNLGLHGSNTFFVARDRKLLPRLAANTLLVSLLIGGGGSLVAWLFFTLVPTASPLSGLLLILALLAVPFGLSYLLFQNLLLGINAIRLTNVVEIGQAAAKLALIWLAIVLGLNNTELIYASTLLVGAVSTGFLLFAVFQRTKQWTRPSLTLFRTTFTYGSKAYIAAFFSFAVLRADLLLVKHYLGNTQAGYYATAISLADVLYLIPVMIGTLLFAKLSGIHDAALRWVYAKKTILTVIGIILPLCLVSAVLITPAIRIVFGETYLPAGPVFRLLLPAIFCLSIATMFQNYMGAAGNPASMIYGPLLATFVNIGADIILIPSYGITGAAYASILAYACMMVTSWFVAQRLHTAEKRQ